MAFADQAGVGPTFWNEAESLLKGPNRVKLVNSCFSALFPEAPRPLQVSDPSDLHAQVLAACLFIGNRGVPFVVK